MSKKKTVTHTIKGSTLKSSTGYIINTTSTGNGPLVFNPGPSSGTWYIGPNQQNFNGPTISVNTDGVWTIGTGPTAYKCSCCKKKNTFFAITYQGYSEQTTRRICNSCYIKKMDKLFGIKSGKVEKLLYEKEE